MGRRIVLVSLMAAALAAGLPATATGVHKDWITYEGEIYEQPEGKSALWLDIDPLNSLEKRPCPGF